eukprot:scaffold90639_cov66-Phaeocystis_antarctica.AAC.7
MLFPLHSTVFSSARGRASRSASQHVHSSNVKTQQGSKARIYVSFYGGEGSTGHLSPRDSAQHSAWEGCFYEPRCARRPRRALFDVRLDELVLAEQVEHEMDGVVRTRLFTEVQRVVWRYTGEGSVRYAAHRVPARSGVYRPTVAPGAAHRAQPGARTRHRAVRPSTCEARSERAAWAGWEVEEAWRCPWPTACR